MHNNDYAGKCDVFFLLSLNDESLELQSISTIKGTIINSPPHSLYGYSFSFTLEDIPSFVRHICTKYIINRNQREEYW